MTFGIKMNNHDESESGVKIETSLNPKDFRADDLPDDLREYE
jgi:hypothetical protein